MRKPLIAALGFASLVSLAERGRRERETDLGRGRKPAVPHPAMNPIWHESSRIVARISAPRWASHGVATTASARVGWFLRRCWNAFQARRERARARAVLYGMDDRMLKDLGLTRSEIGSALTDATGERIRTHLGI